MSALSPGQEDTAALTEGLTLRDFRLLRIDATGHVVLSDRDVDRVVQRLAQFVFVMDQTRDASTETRLQEAVVARRQVLADLVTFGKHLCGCESRKKGALPNAYCTCGFEEALKDAAVDGTNT